jgi:hypothetical protein
MPNVEVLGTAVSEEMISKFFFHRSTEMVFFCYFSTSFISAKVLLEILED